MLQPKLSYCSKQRYMQRQTGHATTENPNIFDTYITSTHIAGTFNISANHLTQPSFFSLNHRLSGNQHCYPYPSHSYNYCQQLVQAGHLSSRSCSAIPWQWYSVSNLQSANVHYQLRERQTIKIQCKIWNFILLNVFMFNCFIVSIEFWFSCWHKVRFAVKPVYMFNCYVNKWNQLLKCNIFFCSSFSSTMLNKKKI